MNNKLIRYNKIMKRNYNNNKQKIKNNQIWYNKIIKLNQNKFKIMK